MEHLKAIKTKVGIVHIGDKIKTIGGVVGVVIDIGEDFWNGQRLLIDVNGKTATAHPMEIVKIFK